MHVRWLRLLWALAATEAATATTYLFIEDGEANQVFAIVKYNF